MCLDGAYEKHNYSKIEVRKYEIGAHAYSPPNSYGRTHCIGISTELELRHVWNLDPLEQKARC
jgi:hypothetical protein